MEFLDREWTQEEWDKWMSGAWGNEDQTYEKPEAMKDAEDPHPTPDPAQDHFKEQFLTAVEQDPELDMSPENAAKVYQCFAAKLKAWGVYLDPAELKEQITFGSPKKPSGASGSKDKDQEEFHQRLEAYHEEWNSSEGTQQGGEGWDNAKASLEEKVAKAKPEDRLAVAKAHEIGEEKKERKESKDKNKKEASSIRWGPVTEKRFTAFMTLCHGGAPLVQPEPIPEPDKTPTIPQEDVIRWGPITKRGMKTLMSTFGQGINPGSLGLGDLVDYAIQIDPEEFHISPAELCSTIKYIHELYHAWNVFDIEEIEQWLDSEWGPLLSRSIIIYILPNLNHLRGYYNPNNGKMFNGTENVAPRSCERPVSTLVRLLLHQSSFRVIMDGMLCYNLRLAMRLRSRSVKGRAHI